MAAFHTQKRLGGVFITTLPFKNILWSNHISSATLPYGSWKGRMRLDIDTDIFKKHYNSYFSYLTLFLQQSLLPDLDRRLRLEANAAVKSMLGMKNNCFVNVKVYFKIIRVHVRVPTYLPFPTTRYSCHKQLTGCEV